MRSGPTKVYGYRNGGAYPAADSYHLLFKADFYAPPRPEGINLNKASIPAIAKKVRAQMEMLKLPLSEEQKDMFEAEARSKAARLLGARKPAEILFARNTTETISFAYWLAGQYKYPLWQRAVLMSDSENASVYRSTHVSLDNGNPDRTDPLTTYDPLGNPERITYPPPHEWSRHDPGNICVFTTYEEQSVKDMKAEFEAVMGECKRRPELMIISQVLRHNGRVIPVKELINQAKAVKKHHYPQNPVLFTCVDGAMAFGNLPEFDLDELGCDLYAISPHKTLESSAVGVARMNLRSPLVRRHLPILHTLTFHDQLLFRRMFDPSLHVPANVEAEINPLALYGLSKAIDEFGNNLDEISRQRQRLKDYARKKLEGLRKLEIPITFSAESTGSPFILSFNLFGSSEFEPEYTPGFLEFESFESDSKEKFIAQKLAERGIALSFLRRGKLFRISFHRDNTFEEIDRFVEELKTIIRHEPA